jgi:flagellar protein FlgJ
MVAPLAMLGLSIAGKIAGGVSDAIANAAKSKPTDATRKTADDFETMFLEQSLDRLTEAGGEDGPLGSNGTGGGIYRSMLSKEYAKSITKSGGLGIADQVYSQMLKLQEGANGTGSP